MKRVTETEFARNLSEYLDAIEHRRESFEVVRNGRPVAKVTPASRPNGAASKRALEALHVDQERVDAIREIRQLLVDRDPWRD